MLLEKVEGSAKDGEIGIAGHLTIGWALRRQPDTQDQQDKPVQHVETDKSSG